MTKMRERWIPPRDGRLKPPKLPLADLQAMDEYQMNLYRLYGNQNPLPRTRRGRVFD